MAEIDDDREAEGYESPEVSDRDDADIDSDEELQEAFAAGLLKPGLNTIVASKEKPKINNVAGLKQKLDDITLKLPWIERLDMVSKPAPLAPELAYQEEQHAKRREKLLKNGQNKNLTLADDTVHNDFKREMLFYRQGQSTVVASLSRLKSMGIPTKRPEDYFAQMAKSDDHMQKIRTKLAQKQEEEEHRAKVRKMRELKKFGKQVQIEVQQRRQKEKKDMLDQVKKFRKGKTDSIDFLDDLENSGNKKKNKPGVKNNKNPMSNKRKFKDDKFGFGGKKKGSKMNTKKSADDVSSYKKFQPKRSGGFNKKGPKVTKRLGKSRRQKAKGKTK